MARLKLIDRLRAQARGENSGVAVVARCRPVPVKDSSCHRVAIDNQSIFSSVTADAASLIRPQARGNACLFFKSTGRLEVVSPRVVVKKKPELWPFELQRRPPGSCMTVIETTVSFSIADEPLPWSDDPMQKTPITIRYTVSVR
jgi:hypothetical protein